MDQRTYRFLFIGNSHTYFNDMPSELFAKIATEAGYNVEVESVVHGGWTLEQHADPEGETGKVVASLLSEESYDFVFLQEQSLRPVVNAHKFHSAARELVGRIRKAGATPLLYCTWARKEGSPRLAELGMTREEMTYALARSYRDIAVELEVGVAYAGLAFFDVGNSVELYARDLLHASREGSYLAALTLFLSIFGDSEQLADCGMPSDITAILKQAARRAVFNISEFQF